MQKKHKDNPNTIQRMEDHYLKLVNKEERFYEWILKYINIPKKGKILDVGCGMGRLIHEIGKHTEAELFGIDVSTVAIEEAKNRYPDINFEVTPGEVFEGQYDLIVCSQTLEHVDDPKIIIDNIVARGKQILITVPWPKSNLDNGVGLHHWRFFKTDFPGFAIKRLHNFMICRLQK